MRDVRYNHTRYLIKKGYIKEFSQIFETIPKSTFQLDIGVNYRRMSRMIEDLGTITITEIYKMSNVLEIEFLSLLSLITREHNRYRNSKKASGKQ